MTAILLALGASLAWSIADFGAGVGARRLSTFVVAAFLQAAGLVVALLVLLATGEHAPTWREAGWAVFASLLGLVGLTAFYRGLAVGTMGIVGPISTCASLVPLAYGLARGERPATHQAVGVALAVAGVVGASLEPQETGRGRKVGAGVGFALVAVAGFGCSLIGLSKAAAGGAVWATLIMRLVALPVLIAVASAVRAEWPGRSLWPLLVGAGIFDTGATLLYAAASTRGLLSVVAVLSSLYPVGILVLARVVLQERVARPQLAGVAVALTGVALVSA
ncbi:MAG: DMT family transporter [Actinomycetota bacterium]